MDMVNVELAFITIHIMIKLVEAVLIVILRFRIVWSANLCRLVFSVKLCIILLYHSYKMLGCTCVKDAMRSWLVVLNVHLKWFVKNVQKEELLALDVQTYQAVIKLILHYQLLKIAKNALITLFFQLQSRENVFVMKGGLLANSAQVLQDVRACDQLIT